MIQKRLTLSAAGLLLLALVVTAGCNTTYGVPRLGFLGYPIPLSPYLQDEMEDNAWFNERYAKTPILEPLAPGVPAIALDEPSKDEVMRALERARPVEGGIPFVYETQRNNVKITIEPIADFVDPPRAYPMVGPAQLHTAKYKCMVYFTEVTRIGWPIPYTTTNEDAREVIYIDHSHLHMVGNVATGAGPAM